MGTLYIAWATRDNAQDVGGRSDILFTPRKSVQGPQELLQLEHIVSDLLADVVGMGQLSGLQLLQHLRCICGKQMCLHLNY